MRIYRRHKRKCENNKYNKEYVFNGILSEISKELKYLKDKIKEIEVLEKRNCILLEKSQEKSNEIIQEIFKNRILNEEQTEEILEELENKKIVLLKK